MLHRIDMTGWPEGRKLFCGPGAIATLTGLSAVEATKAAERAAETAGRPVEGMWEEEVMLVLGEHGFTCHEIDLVGRYGGEVECGVTIPRFLAEQPPAEAVFPTLLVLPTHFVCSHMRVALCDNWTKRPTPVAQFPKPRRLVTNAYVVKPKGGR